MRRLAWFEAQPDLDPDRLVFIDETWASTAMARTHGRAPRGERLRMGVPFGHCKTTTFVAGLRLSGIVAPMVLDGPINQRAFDAYVEQILVPELKPRRHRDHGQSLEPHIARRPHGDRSRRRRVAVPAALQPGLQPDRKRVREAQGPAPQSRRAHRRRLPGNHRHPHRPA